MALAVVGGGAGGSTITGNTKNSKRFHGLEGGMGGAGGPEIIGGAKISMRFHGLARAVGCVGGTRIIAQASSNAGGVGTQTTAQSQMC